MSILGLTINVIRPMFVGTQDSYPVVVVGALTAHLLIRTQKLWLLTVDLWW